MADGPLADGALNYLVYLVMTLGGVILGLVQKHFGGRVTKVEKACEANTTALSKHNNDLHRSMFP